MNHTAFLSDSVILFGPALLVAWMFRILRAPSIIGFLFTGMAIGPSGLGLIASEGVGPIAELGLVLLLFTIGLELSPKPLLRSGKSVLTAAGLQVLFTSATAFIAVVAFMDVTYSAAAVVGIIVSLSSTAIVLKQLHDMREADTAPGRITTGILLIQDMLVIVVMILLPAFGTGDEGSTTAALSRTGLGLAGLLVVVIGSRRILPGFLQHVVLPGGPEFVTLFAVVAAFGGAWLAGIVGWSLPLGACVAGLLLAEADVRHQLAADILPFRDVFNALFFISLGMLVDIDFAVANALPLGIAIAATLVGKSVLTTVAVVAARWPLRPALQIGIGLCTVSEFGYVLAREANAIGLVPGSLLQAITVYALGTMLVGAMLVPIAKPVAGRIERLLLRGRIGKALDAPDDGNARPPCAVLVVGYGVNGENLVRVLKSTRTPCSVIEMNPRRVLAARETGVPVLSGDASRRSILLHAGLETAHTLVVAINDPLATGRVVAQARSVRPELYILARTAYITELDHLYQCGADDVISEDFETSIEIVAHVLRQLDLPDNIVEGQIAAIRSGRYGMLRGKATDRQAQEELLKAFQMTVTRTHFVGSTSTACGKTVAELNLRALTGVSIIAIVRDGKPETNPSPQSRMQNADVLVLVGGHGQLDAARVLLDPRSVEDGLQGPGPAG